MAAPAALLHTDACAAGAVTPRSVGGVPQNCCSVWDQHRCRRGLSLCFTPVFVYPVGTRTASATHVRFRKLRSKSIITNFENRGVGTAALHSTLGREQRGGQQQNRTAQIVQKSVPSVLK